MSDLDDAQRKLVELTTELSLERTRAENAEAQLEYARIMAPANDPDAHDEDEDDSSDDEGRDDITPGQIVYYKNLLHTKSRCDGTTWRLWTQ